MALHPLSDTDRAILDLERTWWQHDRPKDELITEVLGIDPIEYYMTLSLIIQSASAYAADPLLVRRLRREAGGRSRRPRTMHGPVLRGLTHHLDPA